MKISKRDLIVGFVMLAVLTGVASATVILSQTGTFPPSSVQNISSSCTAISAQSVSPNPPIAGQPATVVFGCTGTSPAITVSSSATGTVSETWSTSPVSAPTAQLASSASCTASTLISLGTGTSTSFTIGTSAGQLPTSSTWWYCLSYASYPSATTTLTVNWSQP